MTRVTVFVGDTYAHKVYGVYIVVEYLNSEKVKVRFENSGYEVFTNTTAIRNSNIADPTQRLVFGAGNSHSSIYSVRVGGKKTPQYVAWENMLMRCYYPKTSRYSAYGGKGVRVSDDWLVYENFAKWFDNNYVDGYHLDKDLLGDGTIYSAEYCCYIPQKLNGLFVVTTKNVGRLNKYLPTGVTHTGNSFSVKVSHESNPVSRSFATVEAAHKDYLTRKWNSVRGIATEMFKWTEITERVYEAVLTKCNKEQEPLSLVVL